MKIDNFAQNFISMAQIELFSDTTTQKMPLFDLPVDFIVYDNITASLLNYYGKFPCKIDACIFAYVVKGTARATINLWERELKANDFIIMIPGTFMQIHEVSDDIQVGFAGFSSSFLASVNFWKTMSPLTMSIFRNPVLTMKADIAKIYGDAISLLTRASYIEESILSPGLTKSLFSIFVEALTETLKTNLVKQDNSSISSREQKVLAEFLQLAFENYREEHKISFYAHEANLTLSHFCNVISKTTGMTPQEIIMHLIIMDAKAQLKGTDANVSRIASTLGFSTPSTFNRYFRTYTGMTPQEYRFS